MLVVPTAPVTGKLGVQIFGASTSAVTATLDGKPSAVTTADASQPVVVSFTPAHLIGPPAPPRAVPPSRPD